MSWVQLQWISCLCFWNKTFKSYVLANCYKKVKDETTEFQEVIEKELGLEPIEQEVVVLYTGEKTKQPEEFFQVMQDPK